jgi:hypothetical protein
MADSAGIFPHSSGGDAGIQQYCRPHPVFYAGWASQTARTNALDLIFAGDGDLGELTLLPMRVKAPAKRSFPCAARFRPF